MGCPPVDQSHTDPQCYIYSLYLDLFYLVAFFKAKAQTA